MTLQKRADDILWLCKNVQTTPSFLPRAARLFPPAHLTQPYMKACLKAKRSSSKSALCEKNDQITEDKVMFETNLLHITATARTVRMRNNTAPALPNKTYETLHNELAYCISHCKWRSTTHYIFNNFTQTPVQANYPSICFNWHQAPLHQLALSNWTARPLPCKYAGVDGRKT